MAFDTFIKIDGIEGESTDDKHQGWIEVIRPSAGRPGTAQRRQAKNSWINSA